MVRCFRSNLPCVTSLAVQCLTIVALAWPAHAQDFFCTISLKSGTINRAGLDTKEPEITVVPSAMINGDVTLIVHNTMHSNAVAPLAATPTLTLPRVGGHQHSR